MKNALSGLASQVDALSDADFEARVDEIDGMLDEAIESVLSKTEIDDPKLNALVIISLLETAEHEYEEAAEDGEVKEMVEYQDAIRFISRAEATFDSISADIPEYEAEEVTEFFGRFNELVESRGIIEEVEAMIGGIVHELQEALGLEGEGGEEIDVWAYIGRIKTLLDQALAEHEQGNTQEARRLAVEAYLENYEYIESDIEEDDPELMEKIEIDLREDLERMIDEARPASEIESHIETIKSDLKQARMVVVPEFSLATRLVLGSMAATILAGTLYARRWRINSYGVIVLVVLLTLFLFCRCLLHFHPLFSLAASVFLTSKKLPNA